MRVGKGGHFLLVVVGLLCPSVTQGQRLPVRPGDRVRLASPELPRFVGTVMPGSDDTITIAVRVPGARPDSAGAVRFVRVPLENARDLYVSLGRSHLSGAWPGFVTGLFVGAAFSGFILLEIQKHPENDGNAIGLVVALVAPPLVSAAGGVVGFLIGRENWERVRR